MRESIRRFLCAATVAWPSSFARCATVVERYCPGARARAARTRSRRGSETHRYQRDAREAIRMGAERSRCYRDSSARHGSGFTSDCCSLMYSLRARRKRQVETPISSVPRAPVAAIGGRKKSPAVSAPMRCAVRSAMALVQPWIRHAPFRRRSSHMRAFERERRR